MKCKVRKIYNFIPLYIAIITGTEIGEREIDLLIAVGARVKREICYEQLLLIVFLRFWVISLTLLPFFFIVNNSYIQNILPFAQ